MSKELQKVDLDRRSFLKYCLIGVASFFVNVTGLGQMARVLGAEGPEQIGVLYSTATGIVLRLINPSKKFPHHLDWLEKNKPAGTTLLRINKSDVGAAEDKCPNLKFLIPYVQKNRGITLSFGKSASIVSSDGTVVNNLVVCPVLYQRGLDARGLGHKVAEKVVGNVGDVYDFKLKKIIKKQKGKIGSGFVS